MRKAKLWITGIVFVVCTLQIISIWLRYPDYVIANVIGTAIVYAVVLWMYRILGKIERD
jgi:hypothetical protein